MDNTCGYVDNSRDPADFIEYHGPTWKHDDGGFILPERTLGWVFMDWVLEHIQNEDGGRFIPTPEQARFMMWWYALNEDGSFLYGEGMLQRLKGWGKDPLVAVLALFEALGPCRFDGWIDEERTVPRGKPTAVPLVLIAATTQDQTKTTMKYFHIYPTEYTMKKYRLEINTETVKSKGILRIQAVTSNPKALEGLSPSATIMNETHHWTTPEAHQMAAVIDNNTTKVKGGTSRILAITNAYDPGGGSVAQGTREEWESKKAAGTASGILYDSVEAIPETPLWVYVKDENGEDTREVDVEASKTWIASIVDLIRGDSKWADLSRIVSKFMDSRKPPEENRRFWLNTIVSSEDAWVDIRDYDKTVDATETEVQPVREGEDVVIFFDGSKGDDSTVLMGCRIEDGLVFHVASWHYPRKDLGGGRVEWMVPRTQRDIERYNTLEGINPYHGLETADEAVERAFQTYNVLGFFADPSHALSEVDHKLYWDELIESWHVKYKDQLVIWAGNRSGARSESIAWDMSDHQRIEEFASYAQRVEEAVREGTFRIERNREVRKHFQAARVYTTRGGLESIWKGRRNGRNKIDLAVGAVGAYMVRSRYLKQFGGVEVAYNPLYRYAD